MQNDLKLSVKPAASGGTVLGEFYTHYVSIGWL